MRPVYVLNAVRPLGTGKGFHFILESFVRLNVKKQIEEITWEHGIKILKTKTVR